MNIFNLNDILNPLIWNSDNSLKDDVKAKIVEIVKDFESKLDIPIDIVDVWLVGSNASYNYKDDSDLDVHVIANYNKVDSNPNLMSAVYNLAKASYNKNHDIKIHKLPVELYVQDINSGIESNGIYSICEDRWLKEPKKLDSVKVYNIDEELKKWIKHIEGILNSKDYNKINDAINTLYMIRVNSIAADGEYSKGNQLFKTLRSLGYLQQLKDKLLVLDNERLSLESLSRGALINKDLD